MKYLGRRIPQIDGWDRITGRAEYVTDVKLPGMLHGAILRSPYPHALIVGIDVSAALTVPGVKAVATIEDTPKIAFGRRPPYEDWYIFANGRARFIGEEVAAVAAIDEATARRALKLINVQYEPLPAVFDPVEAMAPTAPSINGREGNVVMEFVVERGEVDDAFAGSALVLERTYHTSQVYQGYLEPTAAVVRPETDGGFTMWLPIQTPNKSKIVYSRALVVDEDKIRVIKPFMGGAFGAKTESNVHLICAVLARKTGRPVRMVNGREEDIVAANPRVPMRIQLKMGFSRDGRFLAKEVHIHAANGARTLDSPYVTSTACYRVDSLYTFQNVRARGHSVDTNTVPTGAFRGFGNAQMTFALESMIDEAATRLNLDPVEIRLRNAIPSGYVSVHGWEFHASGQAETLEHVARMSGVSKRRQHPGGGRYRRGVGVACCNHVSGNRAVFLPFDGSASTVRLSEDGRITVYQGECDMGQGQLTVYAQVAAEALGARLSDVTMAQVDTQTSPFGLGSYASRGTVMGGWAIKKGAEAVRELLLQEASEFLDCDSSGLDMEESEVFVRETPDRRVSFAELARVFSYGHSGMDMIGQGFYTPETVLPDPTTKYGNISPVYPFGSHVAEVEVDTETGEVQVVGYWASHDVGCALNPLLLEGQVQGGVAQGIGWALTEDMAIEAGRIHADTFLDYRMPGSRDVPKVECDFVESNDPKGPYGAKGVGEPAINPVPAAVANAIFDATGVRPTRLPIKPEELLREMNLLKGPTPALDRRGGGEGGAAA